MPRGATGRAGGRAVALECCVVVALGSEGAGVEAFLLGGGDAGALMRSIDWASTPLGPVCDWPTTLRTTVGIMLSSRFAIRILWGPQLIMLHNDAYRPVLGATKYPAAMGKPTQESFREVWPVVGPMFQRVMNGEAVSLVDGPLPLERNGYLEECYFTLSYSPLSDDRGGIGGVLGIVHETTDRVLADRRLRALRQLAAAVSGASTTAEACTRAAQSLADSGEDVPFTLFYAKAPGASAATLVSTAGLDEAAVARLAALAPAESVAEVVTDLRARFGDIHGGPYPEPLASVIVLPLRRAGAAEAYGHLVAGINPRHALDAEYRAFFELVAEHVVAAIANAVAQESAIAHAEASRQFLETVVNHIPAGLIIADASGKTVLANQVVEKILGQVAVPTESIEQFGAYRALHPDGRVYQVAEFPLVRALAGELVLDEEVLFSKPDGSGDIVLSVSSAPVYDAARKLVAGVSAFVDITGRKRTELALRDSEERSRGIVAALEEGIILQDAQGLVVFSNASAQRLVGLADREIEGRRSGDPRWRAVREDGSHYPGDEHAPMCALRTGKPVKNDVMGIHQPDGRLVWLSVNAQPLFDAQGNASGVVTSFFDITAQKSADAERQALLARAQAARSEAEEASRDKDEFLAIVSHELRNPLNAMLGWTRLLRSGSLSEERTARALETIERNATNQAQLIEDLLDISRVISGKLPLDVQTVSFARVVEAAIDSARPAIDAKGLRLSVVLDTEAMLSGDTARLQQVVWNLLTNATKFTPRGGSIRIVLRRDESHVELSVTDSGQGIAPSFLGHVFDRFKQADPSTTRQHGGLGLGLSIAKNLVEMHGGTIEARSEGLGTGATFVVRVPVAAIRRSPIPYVPARSSALPTELVAPPELRGLRVLVVDDEPDARELVMTLLTQCGADVSTAPSAAVAFAAVELAPPDVLLSDIGMPDDDGYSLIRRIRLLPRDRGGETPAACLTGYATVDDRRRALVAGFNMHLAKPIEPGELIAVVANLGRMARALRSTS